MDVTSTAARDSRTKNYARERPKASEMHMNVAVIYTTRATYLFHLRITQSKYYLLSCA